MIKFNPMQNVRCCFVIFIKVIKFVWMCHIKEISVTFYCFHNINHINSNKSNNKNNYNNNNKNNNSNFNNNNKTLYPLKCLVICACQLAINLSPGMQSGFPTKNVSVRSEQLFRNTKEHSHTLSLSLSNTPLLFL